MKNRLLIFIFFIILIFMSGCNVSTIPTDNSAKLLYNNLEKSQVTDKNQKPTLNINKEYLESMLNKISRPKTYTWETQITYTSGDKNLTFYGKQYLYQNKIRSEKLNQNFKLVQLSLFLDSTSYVIDNNTREYNIYKGERPYYPDIFLNISNPLAIIKTNSLDNISNISVDYLDNQSIIYFEIKDDSLSLTEKYWVSLSTGIPLRVESQLFGSLTYIMTTTTFKEEVTDPSIFKIPTYVK